MYIGGNIRIIPAIIQGYVAIKRKRLILKWDISNEFLKFCKKLRSFKNVMNCIFKARKNLVVL